MNLIIKLVIGIVAGLVLGSIIPDGFVRVFVTVHTLIGAFIVFLIPFIILFFITHGIANLQSSSGKTLGVTVSVAYLSTVIAALTATMVALVLIPGLLNNVSADVVPVTEHGFASYVNISIDPVMSVMTALVTAFLFGIGIQTLQQRGAVLKDITEQGKIVIEKTIKLIVIPLLPFYIAGIFTEMAADGVAFTYLQAFGKVLVFAFIMHWVWLLILYALASVISGKNMWRLLKNMLPAYLTAIGTMSSAATIPVTLRQAEKNKITSPVRGFVVPLCANIHLSGSAITVVSCAIAVLFLSPNLPNPTLLQMIPFILTLGVVMIAAPGVPGGAIMAALGILSSILGFTEPMLGLMIALYLAQDSLGTACNVMGDGAIAVIVDKYAGDNVSVKEDVKVKESLETIS